MTPGFRDVLAFAWGHWRRRPRLLAALALLLAGATLAEITAPLFIGRMIDALGHDDPDRALGALAAVIGLGVAYHVCQKGGTYLWCILEIGVMRAIGADAFARVQRYGADWHADTFAGSTVRKITRGLWAFDDFGDGFYDGLIPSAAVVLGVVLIMGWTWPLMALALLACVVLYTAVSLALATWYVAPLRRVAVSADTRLGGAIADAVTCNAVVKATAAEAREDARLAAVLDVWRARMVRAWHASTDAAVAQAAVQLLMQLVLVGGALWLWRADSATPGDVAYVLTSFFVIDRYLRDIGQRIRSVQQAANDMEDVVAIAATPPAVADRPDAGTLVAGAGAVRFEAVRFAYKGKGAPVFDGLSVAIRPGERVALVGRSGSGKTTFVKLVQRLHELDGGRITVDGRDVARVTQESLRSAVALVPQEPVLFHRSLAENIAYARPDASEAEIERAARLAHAHDFIETLPNGYATPVGERGVKLSGGERQRVAIARAILADRPILILDEATSSLDSVSERAIQEALERLMAGRTTLVIAHRLSTIRSVDRILVFDNGRIVEEGGHAELLTRPKGHYRKLYETQAGEFAPRLAG